MTACLFPMRDFVRAFNRSPVVNVEEFGVCESLKAAKPNDVEFKEIPVPPEFYPPGGTKEESWRTLFYANLTASFIGEILSDGDENEGSFMDGARVQAEGGAGHSNPAQI